MCQPNLDILGMGGHSEKNDQDECFRYPTWFGPISHISSVILLKVLDCVLVWHRKREYGFGVRGQSLNSDLVPVSVNCGHDNAK